MPSLLPHPQCLLNNGKGATPIKLPWNGLQSFILSLTRSLIGHILSLCKVLGWTLKMPLGVKHPIPDLTEPRVRHQAVLLA